MSQRLKLGEIVLRAGVIDELQLKSALGQQRKWGGRLGVVLVRMGFVTELELVNAVAGQLNLPIATLDGKKIPRQVLDLIPFDYADDHTCLPLFLKQEGGRETLYVGMDDPSNLDILDDLAFRTGMRVKPVVVSASEICEGIDRFYRDLEKERSPDETQPLAKEAGDGVTIQSTDTSPCELELEADRGDTTLTLLDTTVVAEKLPVETHSPASSVVDTTALGAENEPATHMLLRALTQILIEKGVVTREEIHARMLALRGEGESENN